MFADLTVCTSRRAPVTQNFLEVPAVTGSNPGKKTNGRQDESGTWSALLCSPFTSPATEASTRVFS